MKIIVLTPTFLPVVGGAEIGIYEVCQRLSKSHRIRILTPILPKQLIHRFGTEDTYLTSVNFEVCRFGDIFNLAKIGGQRLLKGFFPPFSISSVSVLLNHINQFKPDLINVHYAIPTGLAATIARVCRSLPVVLSLVGRDIPGPETPFFWRNYVKLVCKNVSEVTFISEYCRKSLFGSKDHRGYVIPYGVDINRFTPELAGLSIKKKLGVPEDRRVLFTLQRLEKIKRVDILIRSLRYVLEVNSEVVLVIGGKGPEESALKSLAKQLKVEDSVIFTGYIPERELPEYFAMADVFTFHSTYETFGIVLAQAMASGLPIVTVNSAAIPEAINVGTTGLLVEPLNPKEFAKAVVDLLNNEELSLKFSQNGRKKAIEKYSWDSIAYQYQRVFEDLLNFS